MDGEWVDEDYEMGSEMEESGEGMEEEVEKEAEELKKGDVEVPEGWKEWRSEKSARMGRFVDESEDLEMDLEKKRRVKKR